MSLLGWIVGRRLANREQPGRKIGAFEGVPAMGLDGLGSSAYGPEAALTILIPFGAAGLVYIGPIMAAIIALLMILYLSYRQTIAAYPSNGGAYIVARENLGRNASLLAAAALMVDYVLNVAVGISAGVAALVSAAPALHPYILPLCLGILGLVTIVNLRGTLDAGRLFALPTYIFVASFFVVLGIGVWKALNSDGNPEPVIPPAALPGAAETAGAWLLMHAFASGCTAMTGVEAVSNGMNAFKDPPVKYGRRTLAAICAILGLLLAGIAYLAGNYRIVAMDQEKEGYRSVLSQLAQAVVGDGLLYYLTIGSLLCVLALSANTSFVGFPRLCRTVATDGFLPRPFAVVGRRLVFSIGIFYLAATAGLLLSAFGGITEHLIPLFAVGAFLTFTISQTGMVVHWIRALRNENDPGTRTAHRAHLFVNGLGAAVTAVALVVIIAAKFTEGAWITVLVIPAVILLLRSIRRYYVRLDRTLRKAGPITLDRIEAPVVLVVTEHWNKLADKALSFAFRLSPDVLAVHVTALEGDDQDDERRIRALWARDVDSPARAAGIKPPRLLLLKSNYRLMHDPLLRLVKELQEEFAGRSIAVLLPEVVKTSWWQTLLHTHRARRLHSKLLRFGGSSLVVISMPWYLEEPEIEEGIVSEQQPEPELSAVAAELADGARPRD
ncbi:amino acid transporter [Sinorhizobium fredii]|uniref:Putative amino acid permease YdaO n=1 Tax=Sinorhizobium fredii (strain USDA 257) TaxID=1185652 RepID=I3XCQ0_SINF2|nr:MULTISPECIES: APC family permease [Sinorhizobium]AFL53656.1 putative amino acid permease YdaO [Sinorhizobium fredii USDA 257]PDT82999.1 APC family permease [Sinorhizobium sp. BJ1]